MTTLIKKVRVTDPSSPFNGQSPDILIENGIISSIGTGITAKADQEIAIENLHVSPGWVDLFADFADPGFEFKETLETGTAAAAAGGYTDVLIVPNTNPVIHNKAGVEYIVGKTYSFPVHVHPIGAVTKNAEGKELAEMYDMKASGALAFSDGRNCIQSAGLLIKALQYLKAVDGLLIQVPDDRSIAPHGLINEGVVSTRLGLPGKPVLAEELVVARDIKLAAYTDARLHFTGISAASSLQHIQQAKQNNYSISCSVTPYHLFFCDEDLQQYDTNLKVNPPLRTKNDRDALRKALAEGSIDCIASHHFPHEFDSKILEFENARNGMIGLETAYAVLNTIFPDLPQEKWAVVLSSNPRKLFGLHNAVIQEGATASLTLFNPRQKWIVEEKDIKSKSKNSPFLGKELTGKVVGIINRKQTVLN